MTIIYNELDLDERAFPNGRVAVLLARYPFLSQCEADEIIAFLKTARRMEIAHLDSIGTVRPKLVRFMEVHRHRLAPPVANALWLCVASLMILLLCWLLWDSRQQPMGGAVSLKRGMASPG